MKNRDQGSVVGGVTVFDSTVRAPERVPDFSGRDFAVRAVRDLSGRLLPFVVESLDRSAGPDIDPSDEPTEPLKALRAAMRPWDQALDAGVYPFGGFKKGS
jgi:hypothetical protein